MYNNLHRKRTLLIKIQHNEGLSLTQFAKKEQIHKYIYPSISLFSPQKNFSTLQRHIRTSKTRLIYPSISLLFSTSKASMSTTYHVTSKRINRHNALIHAHPLKYPIRKAFDNNNANKWLTGIDVTPIPFSLSLSLSLSFETPFETAIEIQEARKRCTEQ